MLFLLSFDNTFRKGNRMKRRDVQRTGICGFAQLRVRGIRSLKSIYRWFPLVGLFVIFASYASAGTFVAFGPTQYIRDTGKPGPVVQTFSVLDPSTTYTLRIDSTGVSSAV